MEKIKKFWSDPVWSKVISAGILAVLAALATYLLQLWPTILNTLQRDWILLIIALVVIEMIRWAFKPTDKHSASLPANQQPNRKVRIFLSIQMSKLSDDEYAAVYKEAKA